MAVPVAHWDEVDEWRSPVAEFAAVWQRLGGAAGSVGVGANRIRIDPGSKSTPVHTHGASEEIFYVLRGSGLLWQESRTHEVGPGDCIVHAPFAGDHTLLAGDEGPDVLVFGTRHPTEFGSLPRAGVLRFGADWVEISSGVTSWEREAAAGALEVRRRSRGRRTSSRSPTRRSSTTDRLAPSARAPARSGRRSTT